MLTKLRAKFDLFREHYFLSAGERKLRAALAFRNGRPRKADSRPMIVLQCCPDMLYVGVFGEIIAAIRRLSPVRAELYDCRSLRHSESSTIKSAIWVRLLVNPWTDRRWEKLYGAYCDSVGVRSAVPLSPGKEWRIWKEAFKLWRGIRDVDEFARLTVRGILIGDLVIDSFLRFKPSPEFVAADRYNFRILRQALRDMEKAHAYFNRRRPDLFLTSYTSYVHHGIPARVAIALGIKVISFGNYQHMCKSLGPHDHTHLAEHWNYLAHFHALPPIEQDRRRAEADQKLQDRMRGEIDNSIGYMRASAYKATGTDIPDVVGAAIIYMPDFFDGIHVYRWTVFHDFWKWACFTIDGLKSANVRFLIKPHPNAYEESKQVYDQLLARYPEIDLVPDGVTTVKLAEAGIACGISPRGTVLSELGYLGVPVIAAGDHPHAGFDLTPPPETVEQYGQRLKEASRLPRDPKKMRRRACEFYAMHNLSSDADETALRDHWLALRAMTMSPQLFAARTGEFIDGLCVLAEMPAFQGYIRQWFEEISRAGHGPAA